MSAQSVTDVQPEHTPKVLFEGEAAILARSDDVMVFESGAFFLPHTRALLIAALILASGISALTWSFLSLQRDVSDIVVVVGLITAFNLPAIFRLAYADVPRYFVFDFLTRSCRFSTVPGFGLTIPFSDIEAIDILQLKDGNVLIGMAIRGRAARLAMHVLVHRNDNSRRLDTVATVLTDMMARPLECPVRVVPDATFRMCGWR